MRCTWPRLATLLIVSLLAAPAAEPSNRQEAEKPTASDAGGGGGWSSDRPNVFLIVIDTLRADHLSSYGYRHETSPHLDALAAEGILYETAISPSSWTLPSHASLFTGLPVRDHGTHSRHLTLEARYDTLAEKLRRNGYDTAGFSNNVWTNDASGLKQGFDTFLELWRHQNVRQEGISSDDPTTDMGADRTNDEIFSWLEAREGDDRPVFVFINYFEPHLPFRPTRPFDARFRDFLRGEVDDATVQRLRSFYSPREYGYILRVPWMKVSDRDLEVLSALYDGEIAYVDAKVHELVEGLRERELLDETVLVITSDHGEHLGENHMLSHKFSVYEPLLRVPLILWGPGRVPAGRRVTSPVQTQWSFGTILELAGLEPETSRPLPWKDEEPGYTFAELAYPEIFLEVVEEKIPGWDTGPVERALDTVRGPRYKLISGSDGSIELYDLESDPGEATDLEESQPETVERLLGILEEFERGERPR